MTLVVCRSHEEIPAAPVAISDAPCLIEFAGDICITGIRLALPWSQLTLLELDESRGSLSLLPSIPEGDLGSEHLELPSLRVIHSIDEPPALEGLLVPNLQHIILSHGQDPFGDGASGNQRIYYHTFRLLQRSRCAIQTVEFRVPTHGTKLSSRGVERILQQSRSVQEVRFVVAHISSISNIDWGHLGTSFTFERLQTLSFRVARHRAFFEESGMLVPEINRTLDEDTKEYFRDSDMDLRVLEEYRRNGGALLDMLESRSRLPELQNVYLDFADSPYLHWFTVPQVVDRLRRLVIRDMVYVQIQGVNFSKLVSRDRIS
ncbi:hypothetical protein VNI00_014172 [Paramarasmius palmivorus]|uniref:Uncharacterized protein n=1 Tax=Paramarasmius palmivorus TaxID=297713 RepID=A0AAW0BUM5_9AGAR